MSIKKWSVCMSGLALLSGLAQGEVITGSYPTEQIKFHYPSHTEYIEELGLTFYTSVFGAGGGSNTTNYAIGGSADVIQYNVRMLTSGNAGGNRSWVYFNEGQSLAGYDSARNEIGLASSTYDPEFGTSWASIGSPGQMLYIGFMVQASGGSFERNFGFFQIEKGEGHLDFNVVGWAYETQAGVDLATFNIPAPSGVALFGFAALGVTRRRRS